MNGAKMAALEKVNRGTGFHQKQNLARLVDAEEIGDGLFDAVVENAEVLAMKTSDKAAVWIGDDHSYIDAVHADANVGRILIRLLRKTPWSNREEAKEQRGRASRGKKHCRKSHRRPEGKKTEALFCAEFPEGRTGLEKVSIDL
jgi:hypothetical protein